MPDSPDSPPDSPRRPGSPYDAPTHDPFDESSWANDSETARGGKWSEDVLAIAIGAVVLAVSLIAVLAASKSVTTDAGKPPAVVAEHPLSGWLAKPGGWTWNPLAAFAPGLESEDRSGAATWPGVLGVLVLGLVAFGLGARCLGESFSRFAPAFLLVFALATLAYLLAGQQLIKASNLGYALWALALGLIVSNTVGTPNWVRPGLKTEFYIKTGLVILGAEILFGRLLSLGVPGVFVAWIVTPVVLISTFWFGQRILRIPSPSLNMVISADMSVCGVSAAIAAAAACRAKKEELSLAIGLSLSFTVLMMVVMPAIILAVGMDPVLGGAWMGGTIDATGAVAAAGAMLGDDALQVAATVKMIQNILIGVSAFLIAVYWVTSIEKRPDGSRPGVGEIWTRFPKFIIGFIAASIVFSLVHAFAPGGPEITDASIAGATKKLRGWFFCLAFVSIGLETNFRDLSKYLRGGRPLVLYLAGQSLNVILTLAMAYLMFKVVFPGAAEALKP